MRYVNPLSLESRTRPEQLPCRGIVALAPLVMLVWFAYWVGLVSQACCLPPLSDAHHSSHTGEHDAHHDGVLAIHEQVPTDHGCCPQLKRAELAPASTEALTESTQKQVLIALLSLSVPPPISIASPGQILFQQSHPPPNRYLRNRRLLI